jgi:hypothetical protein
MHQRLQRGGGDIYNDEERGKMDEIVKLFEKYSDFWNLIECVLKPGNTLEEQVMVNQCSHM